jgi:formate/nitrite transporter FocA (FNT family)
MSTAPTPREVYERAAEEGDRRLNQSLLELVATAFIAGFTITFGMAALGIVEANLKAEFGSLAHLGGALALGTGVVFLVIGRAELFSENFFDPAVRAVEASGSYMVGALFRLWSVTFVFNLVGGGLMVAILTVEGALPPGTEHVFRTTSSEIVSRGRWAEFADAISGGVLVTMLSFSLSAVEESVSRILLSYVVGVLLALGPFSHVVVTVLHVLFGVRSGAPIGVAAIVETTVVVTAGNLVGGLGIGTFTHVVQARGSEEAE